MRRSRKRLLYLFLGLVVVVAGSALLYKWGMAGLEGKPRTYWESLEWATESLSTTGYGYDSHWNHPLMVLLVMAVQFLGVFLVFLIFPIYLIPFLEERFETRLPKQAEAGLADHAVLYRYGPAVETLLVELAGAGVLSLVLEPEEGLARRLFDRGQRVVLGGLADDGPGSRASFTRPGR